MIIVVGRLIPLQYACFFSIKHHTLILGEPHLKILVTQVVNADEIGFETFYQQHSFKFGHRRDYQVSLYLNLSYFTIVEHYSI